jgi:hypothetical protein
MTAKTGIVLQEEAAVAMQRRGKDVPAATNQHATLDDLLESVFSVRSVTELHG